MKAVFSSKLRWALFLGAVVALAGSAWAANKGSLSLLHPTSVAGTKLPSGNYTVQWQGSGDQVDLKIFQGKKEVASTSAKVVQLNSPAAYDSAVVSSNDDGTATLSEIRFSGKKMALEVSSEGGSGGAAGPAR